MPLLVVISRPERATGKSLIPSLMTLFRYSELFQFSGESCERDSCSFNCSSGFLASWSSIQLMLYAVVSCPTNKNSISCAIRSSSVGKASDSIISWMTVPVVTCSFLLLYAIIIWRTILLRFCTARHARFLSGNHPNNGRSGFDGDFRVISVTASSSSSPKSLSRSWTFHTQKLSLIMLIE